MYTCLFWLLQTALTLMWWVKSFHIPVEHSAFRLRASFICLAVVGACSELSLLDILSILRDTTFQPWTLQQSISYLMVTFTYTTMLKLVNKLTFSSLIVPCLPLGAAPNPSPHLATMTKYVVTRLGCQIRIMALAISLLTCNRVDT